jgi:hypothetical protein
MTSPLKLLKTNYTHAYICVKEELKKGMLEEMTLILEDGIMYEPLTTSNYTLNVTNSMNI